VARWDTLSDTWEIWLGPWQPPFPIDPLDGRAYLVRVNTSGELKINAIDGTSPVTLLGPAFGLSNSGTHTISLPWATPLDDASDLLSDIGPSAVMVGKYETGCDTIAPYPGGPDFNIVPGEGYFVRVVADTIYTPSLAVKIAALAASTAVYVAGLLGNGLAAWCLGGLVVGLLGVQLVRRYRGA
jgi:hypothetical protein